MPQIHGLGVQPVANIEQRRRDPRLARGLGDQARVLEHVGDGRLDLEIARGELRDLHPRHAARHRPGVEHRLQSMQVHAMGHGEIDRHATDLVALEWGEASPSTGPFPS
jgi:hypothetical protein